MVKSITVVFLALFLLSVASVSAATINVPGVNGPTIQAAINAANAGDTILVSDGTYPESFTINKALTLQSVNGNAVTTIELQKTPTYLGGIMVQASDVTIDGFTIKGYDATCVTISDRSSSNIVVVNGFSNINILNNLILVGKPGACEGLDEGFGLITYYTETGPFIDNLVVQGNEFRPLTDGGRPFFVNTGVIDFTFEDNIIVGLGRAYTQAQNGIIKDNIITGTGSEGARTGGIGCWGYPDSTVWGKTVFTGNTISGGATGIVLYSCQATTIEDNDLSNNDVGILIEEDGAEFDASTLIIQNNNIVGNLKGIVYTDDPAETVDATLNWWGCQAGPGQTGCDTVEGHVATVPDTMEWLCEESPTTWTSVDGICESVKVTIIKYVDGVHADSTSAKGVNFPMAASWDALNIGAGSGSFNLGPTGFNNPLPYEATTIDMRLLADYSVYEQTSADVLASTAACVNGKFRLVGYTTGEDEADAAGKISNITVPALTDIITDKIIIVWNHLCVDVDGDGYEPTVDCNDNNPLVHPGVADPCDGVNNDCDTLTDEDFATSPTTCGRGACASTGVTSCVAGVIQNSCVSGIPTPEVCDVQNVDEDCDGSLNEGCSCVNGETRSCGTDVGECKSGTQTCAGGQWGLCIDAVWPADEIYGDTLDNDCDGLIDETIQLPGYEFGLDTGDLTINPGNRCPEILEGSESYHVWTWYNLLETQPSITVPIAIIEDWLDDGSAGRSYAFEGERIEINFSATDQDGVIDDCTQGYMTVECDSDPEVVQCVKDVVVVDDGLATEHEQANFVCNYFVGGAEEFRGKCWISVSNRGCQQTCSDLMPGLFSVYLNPSVGITYSPQDTPFGFMYDENGDSILHLVNGEVLEGPMPGDTVYTPYFTVENSAEYKAGVYILLQMYGTDFKAPYTSTEVPMCADPITGITSNVLTIENMEYKADFLNVHALDLTGIPSLPLLYPAGDEWINMDDQQALVFQNEPAANFLGVGEYITMRLRLHIPSPCQGSFTEGGEVMFVATVI